MIFKQLFPNLFLVTANTKQELAQPFVRMQGFVDSVKFRHKIFTVNEYETWFAKSGGNVYDTFVGYNIPGSVIHFFNQGGFKNITDAEATLLKTIYATNPPSPFYVIGLVKGNQHTLKHELAHALYYLNPQYKAKATEIAQWYFKNMSNQNATKLYSYFALLRYHKDIWVDELQANLIAQNNLQSLGIWDNVAQSASANLTNLFNEYYLQTFGQTADTTIANN